MADAIPGLLNTPESIAPEADSATLAGSVVTPNAGQQVEPLAGGPGSVLTVAAGSGPVDSDLAEARAQEVAFSWQASEYVHHRKGPGWYAGFIGGLAALSALAIWLHFWLTIGAFVAMGIAIVVYAHRPPRTLLYELTPTGITIDGRQFDFSQFRSFGVLPDEEWHSIDLEPVKRFDPRMTILFDDADFDEIVGHLELHLSRIDRQPDIIERLSRYLRF